MCLLKSDESAGNGKKQIDMDVPMAISPGRLALQYKEVLRLREQVRNHEVREAPSRPQPSKAKKWSEADLRLFNWRSRNSGDGALGGSQESPIRTKLLAFLLVALILLPATAEAEEHGRIKWRRPTPAEADRVASESAVNDSILRKGDIVVTDHGFLMFRGFLADGTTADFVPIQNPMSTGGKR
jgi:hypothetical protein